MAFLLARLVGGAETDDRLAADEGGLVGVGAGLFDGRLHGGGIVTVHIADDVPVVGLEAGRGIVEEPGRCFGTAPHLAIDGDVVVVVEGDELAEAQGAGQGAGLVGDPFHHAAVPQKHVGTVVHDVVAGTVELGGQHLLGQCHADGVGDTLAEGAGGGLDTGGVTVFRVAGGLGVELAEVLEFFDGERIARQMEQRVDQHGAMAVGQDEAVTVGPRGVGRVVLQVVVPQDFGDVSHAHGSTGMAGFGFLDRIHTEGADGVG